MKAYLAGSIFYYGDYLRNKEWAAKIRRAFPSIDLYSPIENTDINGVEGKKKFAGSIEIALADNQRLDDTDVLIACIDGDVLPSGTCAEIGKFHEKIMKGEKKYLIGICTDNRQCALTHSEAKDAGGAKSLGEQQYSYQNLYVTGLIKEVGFLVNSIDEAIELMSLIEPKDINRNKCSASDRGARVETKKDNSVKINNHNKERHESAPRSDANATKPKSEYSVDIDVDFDDALEKLYGSLDKFYKSASGTRFKTAFEYLIDILTKEEGK